MFKANRTQVREELIGTRGLGLDLKTHLTIRTLRLSDKCKSTTFTTHSSLLYRVDFQNNNDLMLNIENNSHTLDNLNDTTATSVWIST